MITRRTPNDEHRTTSTERRAEDRFDWGGIVGAVTGAIILILRGVRPTW